MIFGFGKKEIRRGPDHFVAVDVETANSERGSICQIGIAEFDNWQLVDKWVTLVNPQCEFDEANIGVHSITPDAVRNAPSFGHVYKQIKRRMENRLVVSHTLFDQEAISEAIIYAAKVGFACDWIDSSRVVRHLWPEYRKKGFGLGNLKQEFGMTFQHHDALEDAIAAGEILCMAAKKSNLGARELGEMSLKKISISYPPRAEKLEGKKDGPLSGHVCVLSGDFPSDKANVSKLLNELGAAVHPNVTKKTSLLVVGGLEDTPTGKVKKALEYAERGQSIEIVDLKTLVGRLKRH
ncbi:DNA polymerase-3 subunit epsilon [Maritalea mobilis]|uniref:DNA polymerase-3 subunit epsilon n=1 Tax=Maritalea mobilis TaxID=483324 RepID=A0A4R6VIZ7_9HYPH|nr:exonuclease domain-containing protein [Maritalea mobilis]TDQ63569.1 DNA polymerase-3 subunit epsilon [Maritalea mobilis]